MTGDLVPAAAAEVAERADEPLGGAGQERALPRQAVKQRLGEIRQYRLTKRVKYYQDAAVLEEERRLLSTLDGSPGHAPAPSADQRRPGDVVPLMPLAEWSKVAGQDGDRDAYRRAVMAANDMLRLAGDDAAAFENSFSSLPERVQETCLSEIVNRRAVSAAPITEAEMKAIVREGGNAELAREWGGYAPEMFGRVRARLWRAVDRMNEQDAVAFINWFARLPPGASASLQRWLAT